MSIRLISRLDVKMSHLIKGVQMEGWRKLGDPAERAAKYYNDGVDEILYVDVVASLYQRNNLHEIVRSVASMTFVPITVGGGISDIAAAKSLMTVGADKIAINTAATKRPAFLRELCDAYGSQAVVLNIEAKSLPGGGWTVMTDNGRNHTGRDAVAWAVEATKLGVGEIILSSVDRDGTMSGVDANLIQAVSAEVDVPIVASGGCATAEHVKEAIEAGADAVAIGAALHKGKLGLDTLKKTLLSDSYDIRPPIKEDVSCV